MGSHIEVMLQLLKALYYKKIVRFPFAVLVKVIKGMIVSGYGQLQVRSEFRYLWPTAMSHSIQGRIVAFDELSAFRKQRQVRISRAQRERQYQQRSLEER